MIRDRFGIDSRSCSSRSCNSVLLSPSSKKMYTRSGRLAIEDVFDDLSVLPLQIHVRLHARSR